MFMLVSLDFTNPRKLKRRDTLMCGSVSHIICRKSSVDVYVGGYVRRYEYHRMCWRQSARRRLLFS